MKKTIVVNLLLNTVGAFLYTVAINGFLISNHLGEGGVTGLMTIFYYLLKIAPSLTNIVLNGLLLLIGWKLLNKQTVFYTLYTITMISVFLKLIGSMRFPLHDPLVAALIGGALMGVAMGFIMKGEGTLAGSTILARIVNKFFGIKTGSAMLCFDLMVAIPSAVIIGFENMLLTIVELYLSAVILNKLLAQFVEKRSLTILGTFRRAGFGIVRCDKAGCDDHRRSRVRQRTKKAAALLRLRHEGSGEINEPDY